MKGPEYRFKAKLKKKLQTIPDSSWRVNEAGAVRGYADIDGHIKGRAVYLEVKKNKQESRRMSGRTVLQRLRLSNHRDKGAIAFFVYPENEKEVLEYLSSIGCGIEILLDQVSTDPDWFSLGVDD